MGEEGGQTLYTTDDTGNYVEYTPPEPPAFNETLPEDIRESEHLQGVEDGATLARYYVDLKKDYLARPETADGYDFEKPDDYSASDEELARIKQTAFEAGMNQKQFDHMMGLNVATQKEAMETFTKSINEKHDAAEAELKKEWGDEYEKKLEAANSFLNHESLADEEFKQFLKNSRFGDNVNVVRFFEKVSRLISEDAFKKPGNGGGPEPSRRTEDGRPMLRFPSMEKK